MELLKEEISRIRLIMGLKGIKRNFISEQEVSSKTIINVDIQPEYEDGIYFLHEWVSFLNNNYHDNDIVFLYNGANTLGMISEGDYQMWLIELGVNEEVLDESTFYDKGYAFFRYCMDEGIDDEELVVLIRFMSNHNINDSREIDEEMWRTFKEESGYEEIADLLEIADDMIYIPDLMEFINRYDNIVLTGGGINECLREVEISLLSLNKPYNVLRELTY